VVDMRINKLEIKGFGKICNLVIELKDGLNIIYGQNESGKSTLQWFIKGMLFGLKGGRTGRDGALPPLKRFRPWKGGYYGGVIEYSLNNGEEYRVERDFEKGSVSVYDSSFNDLTGTFPASRERGVRFAEEHLGVTEACFDGTVFIKQMESRLDGEDSKELLNRLVNISETGFEDVSFRKAEKALKDALKNYVGTDRTSTRPMDKVLDRLQELKAERSRLADKRNSLFSVEHELNEAVEASKSIEAGRDALLRIRELIGIKRELEKCRRQEAGLKEVLDDITRAEAEMKDLKGRVEEWDSRRRHYDEYFESRRSKASGYRKRLAGYGAVFLFIAAVLFTVLGFAKNPAGFIAAAVSLLAAAALIAGSKAYDKLSGLPKHGEEELSKLEAVYGAAVDGMMELSNDLREMYGRAASIYGKPFSESDEILKAVQELSGRLDVLQAKLKTGITEIKGAYGDAAVQYAWEDRLNRRLSNAELEDLELWWEQEYDRSAGRISEMHLKIREYETVLKSLCCDDEIQRIDEEIAELELRRNQLEELNFSLSTALELLEAAGAEIRKDYTPELNARMGEIINKISGGKYGDLRADDSLSLKTAVPETGEVTPGVLLSGGTIDQMYLALRLAAADLIVPEGKKLPLILDEVFAQYDDIRTAKALEFLDELSADRQVILFTCKAREVDIARQVCTKPINLIRL